MPPARKGFALTWIALIAAWVLTGALFKLSWGTPALLPEAVRGVGLELGLTYKLVIGIELAIVAVALLQPRWGWPLQAALLVVFDVVLTTQISAGTENCGCFGAKLSVPPWLMLGIDSVLLVGLLLARPWSSLAPRPAPLLAAAAAAAGLALPWLFDREVQVGEVVADGQPAEGQWIELALEKWVGLDVASTPLGQAPLDRYIDVYSLPLDGLWVFYRSTCEHCAEHLAHLAQTETGERALALIRLEERTDSEANRVVHVLPDGNFVVHAALPAGISYILQTPGEVLVEGGMVVAGAEGVTSETGLGSR